MALFLWIGCACGAALGLLHAYYLYRQIVARDSARAGAGVKRRGLYYGIWTFALWTIFGSYVLALWLIGAIAFTVLHVLRRQRAP